MVVDHIAKPRIAAGETEPWAIDMAAVAAIPGVYCKVSGMVTEADHMHWTVDDLKPYVAHVVEEFDFDRLMWGSDWPVCLLASSYAHVLNSALEAIGDLAPEQRTKFLAQTLGRTYDGLPTDGTSLSKSLFKLASQLAVRGVSVERLPRGRQRGIRLVRR